MLRERRGQGFLCRIYRERKLLGEALSVLCVPLLSVCVFKEGCFSCSACVLGKGNYSRVWKKKLLEKKWNQKPRSQIPVILHKFKSRSALQTALENGRIRSIAQGTASSHEEVGSRVQILQLIFLPVMVFTILRLESGEVYLASQFSFLWSLSKKLKWKDLCPWK